MPLHVATPISDSANLPHECRVDQCRSLRDSLGGNSLTWEPGPTVKCFVQSANQKEIEEFAKRGARITHKVFMDDSVTITEDRRLVFSGRELKVMAVMSGTVTLFPRYHKIMVEEKLGDIDT